MNHWLVKTEPATYSWQDLKKDTRTIWDGVRNYGARNNLRAMKKGDLVFVYHSGEEKSIQGIAKVTKEAFSDASAPGEDWSAVELTYVKALKSPLSLTAIKKTQSLKHMALVKNSRLSVQPVTSQEWGQCLDLAQQ